MKWIIVTRPACRKNRATLSRSVAGIGLLLWLKKQPQVITKMMDFTNDWCVPSVRGICKTLWGSIGNLLLFAITSTLRNLIVIWPVLLRLPIGYVYRKSKTVCFWTGRLWWRYAKSGVVTITPITKFFPLIHAYTFAWEIPAEESPWCRKIICTESLSDFTWIWKLNFPGNSGASSWLQICQWCFSVKSAVALNLLSEHRQVKGDIGNFK